MGHEAAQAAEVAAGGPASWPINSTATRQKERRRERHRAPSFRWRSATSARRGKPFAPDGHIVDGVDSGARLVNDRPNVLYPIEFARRASQLRKVGVDVEFSTSGDDETRNGCAARGRQGSTQPSRPVSMRWNGGKRGR